MALSISVGDIFNIDGFDYKISEHPSAPGLPYGQEGRRATVYQLTQNRGRPYALKMFKTRFRVPRMVAVAEKLIPFAKLPGLQVCQRTVLTSKKHPEILAKYPELTYAVLMPWVDGDTWQEILLSRQKLSRENTVKIAQSFASILVDMEERGLAHCDLSAPNIMISPDHSVSLVDLEEMYGPDFIRPAELPAGSSGYAHRSVRNGAWQDDADRFAGAVILAEILGCCDGRVRDISWGESYFDPDEMQQNCERYQILKKSLSEHWGGKLAHLYEQAWHSDSLRNCPTFADWNIALQMFSAEVDEISDQADKKEMMVQQISVAVLPEIEADHRAASVGEWVCSNCGRLVPDNLKTCPNCEGVNRIDKKSKSKPGLWLLLGIILISLLIIGFRVINQNSAPMVDPIAATPTHTLTLTPKPTDTKTPSPTAVDVPTQTITKIPTSTSTLAPTSTPIVEGVLYAGTGEVRSGPSETYSAMFTIPLGTQVRIFEKTADGTWLKVGLQVGSRGWVNSQDIQSDSNFTNLPISTPPAAPTLTTETPIIQYRITIINAAGTPFDCTLSGGYSDWVRLGDGKSFTFPNKFTPDTYYLYCYEGYENKGVRQRTRKSAYITIIDQDVTFTIR